jgi:hypothetical protein
VYEGEMFEGRPHGSGKMTCLNGDFQHGQFAAGASTGVCNG